MNSFKRETWLRIMSMFLLALTACLVGFDSQTKVIFYTYKKTATFHVLDVLYVLVWIDVAAAAYNLLQLITSYKFQSYFTKDLTASYRYVAWGIFLLDQAAAYAVFGVTAAAVQGSTLAITGEKSFQWMKLCNRFTRFCIQIGGALICGYIAAVLMVITASISAYSLFRIYSPKRFLMLKPK
ncbi:CASP-like protein 2C1 [Salvia miltiorrhiza]|uniref:CASP-like protein 2C1 n=1 Tax=Salvia miltiorrhiza TaxID=226208 RepID=UPI0025AD727A|nr:CASP-like protein 2C1 [Salvia miltiorrhiza]